MKYINSNSGKHKKCCYGQVVRNVVLPLIVLGILAVLLLLLHSGRDETEFFSEQSENLFERNWLGLSEDQDMRQIEVNRREPFSDPDIYLIEVNRTWNIVTIYERDEHGEYTIPVRAMWCSTGEATPTGSFCISDRYEWRALFGDVYGQYATRITDHILFHSVPYLYDRKDALCYEEYNKLGTSASAGCVRLCVADAKWIYTNCAAGTQVVILDSIDAGPLNPPEFVPIDPESPYRGWDPTDPDPANPWNGGISPVETEKNEQWQIVERPA